MFCEQCLLLTLEECNECGRAYEQIPRNLEKLLCLGAHAHSEHTVVTLCVCSSYICSAGGNQVKVNVYTAIKPCFLDLKFGRFVK